MIFFFKKPLLFLNFLRPPGETIWASLSYLRGFYFMRWHPKWKGICVTFSRNEGTVALKPDRDWRENSGHLSVAPFCALFSLFWYFPHQTKVCRTLLLWPEALARSVFRGCPLLQNGSTFPLCPANLLFHCHTEQRCDRRSHWCELQTSPRDTREWHS